ncbi:hypothetical protein HDU67_005440, partial [Dinochytrium kinnereticum]
MLDAFLQSNLVIHDAVPLATSTTTGRDVTVLFFFYDLRHAVKGFEMALEWIAGCAVAGRAFFGDDLLLRELATGWVGGEGVAGVLEWSGFVAVRKGWSEGGERRFMEALRSFGDVRSVHVPRWDDQVLVVEYFDVRSAQAVAESSLNGRIIK